MGATAGAVDGATIYAELAEPDQRWLQRTASELRVKLRRTVEDVVASGRLLAQARRRLGRQWRPWLAAEAQIPIRSASRLVNVGRAFGTLSGASLRHFTPTALYALSEPGVSQSIREYAVLRAKDGEEITAAKVAEWVELQRENAEPKTRTEARELLKLAPDDDEPADNYHDPAEVFAPDNWRLLVELVGEDGTVHLSAAADAESDTESVTFSGVHIDGNGQRKYASGGTVEQVVLLLAGGVRKKVCPRCCVNKPLDEFCIRRDMPDGREFRCKMCERERVKAHAERKNAERKAAAG
jgi:hypothetical protein